MNRRGRIGWVIGLALLLNLGAEAEVAAANRMQDIRIEVELQEDGSGVITEHRQMELDEGTELYITLENLQDSELLDFSVVGFEEEPDWDTSASREEKAGKYGVVETGTGLELIWGIGEYGVNTYEVTYTLSNLVRELEDGQGLLWNFDTFSSIPAENLTLEITGPEPFTEDNARFWGFGFEGDIQNEGGRIVWEASEEVDSSNDVTVLLQFPPQAFATQAVVGMTLAEQRETAMQGSTYQEDAASGDESNTGVLLLVGGAIAAGIGAVSLGVAYSSKVRKAKEAAGEIRMDGARYRKNEGQVYDAVPFADQDVAGIAYLLQGIQKGEFDDYFAAYLMKWAEEGRIQLDTADDESDRDKHGDTPETTITILNFEEESRLHSQTFGEHVKESTGGRSGSYELGMWIMLLDAADRAGFVTGKRMGDWAGAHASELGDYAAYLEDYSKDYLIRNGYITLREVEVWGRRHEIVVATEAGEQLLDRLTQFENYLAEMETKGFPEEADKLTFGELLFWSALYSRIGEVSELLEAMLQAQGGDYGTGGFYHYYWYWNGMAGFHDEWYSGYHAHSSPSGSSGFGGSTSFGGGGGAGGGGGGGAR